MVTARTRELLIGAGLAHCIASLEGVLERHHFSADQQAAIALALFETETINDAWRPVSRTVH